MSEQNFETVPCLPNKLAEFVIDNTPYYEDLHAATLQEGDDKFRVALVEALKNSQAGEALGSGSYYRVYGLEGDDRVAIKQLQAHGYDNEELGRLWQEIQDEHHTIVTYFGSRFIPDTEFLTLNQQYIVVQEQAAGKKFFSLPEELQTSPELKQDVIEYVMRCERMMRAGILLDHPDDLMIDDAPDATRRVTLLDTNSLANFTDIVAGRNTKIFLEEYGIDPASIRTPEDIIHMIHTLVPSLLDLGVQETEELREQAYSTLMSRLRYIGDLLPQLRNALQRLPSNPQSIPSGLRGNRFLDQLLFHGFCNLASLADRCAPQGQHPQLLARIMETFGVDDTDLQ